MPHRRVKHNVRPAEGGQKRFRSEEEATFLDPLISSVILGWQFVPGKSPPAPSMPATYPDAEAYMKVWESVAQAELRVELDEEWQGPNGRPILV